jgi:hypothetical protein
MAILKKQRITSLLGLSLEGGRLEGALLRRTNGSVKVQKTLSASLTLNPLSADPELVGREIRNHLEGAGIRERRCTVCLPLSWASTQVTKVPSLSEEDVKSFLQIEAERGFHYGHEALSIANSRYRRPGGEQYATLVAVPMTQLLRLEQVLRSAQLRPLSFALGITALQPPAAGPESAQGVLALSLGESHVDLQVTCGGGVAALRSLDGAVETEGAQRQPQADRIAREIRITLGQLPAEFRDAVRVARFFGDGELAEHFAEEMAPRLEAIGMRFEHVRTCGTGDLTGVVAPETAVSAALVRAVRCLRGADPGFEFLPPRVSSWQKLTAKVSSKKLFWTGAAAAAAAGVIGGAFLVQQWRLSSLKTRWTAVEPQARELDDLQQRIRKFRPWFDESFGTLSILRKVTQAFPETGEVTAKSLEIRNLSTVACGGMARDNQALLKMLDQLRANREVGKIKVDQIKGGSPLQFTFNFHWTGGGALEN